jgi:diguanylate cyclase (GGDEF)-like protein
VKDTLKLDIDLFNAPTEREFVSSMVMTSLVILVVSVGIATGVTWYLTKGHPPDIHAQAVRTSIVLPMVIVPICTSIIAYLGLRNHQRMLAVTRLALTDDMTGLANRRAFMRAADALFEATDLDYDGLCLFIIDLDHFKQVNDVHGHETGDVVLIHAAKQIEIAAPNDAIVARLGGEEFAVLMRYKDSTDLFKRAEAIRAQIASTPCIHQNICINLSASVGVGIAHPRDSVSSVMSRADDALYEAKDKGRNRFIIAA